MLPSILFALLLGTAQHGDMTHTAAGPPSAAPAQPGQAAFAAVEEIVALLEADPATVWSTVDVGALRDHLADMDRVMVDARVRAVPVPRGMRYEVSGDGPVRESIRRMVAAHAAMAAETGFRFAAAQTPDGAALTATADSPAAQARIRGLGFFGLLVEGAHHQSHHLMMAKGAMAH
jgi:hypothetical protein